MSTILDALKKVEAERESPREQLLHATAEAPVRQRSSLPLIAACAVVGLTAGIGLALWRNGRSVDLTALPDVSPPPAIAVPKAAPARERAPSAKADTPRVPDVKPPAQGAAGDAESTTAAAAPPVAPAPPAPPAVAAVPPPAPPAIAAAPQAAPPPLPAAPPAAPAPPPVAAAPAAPESALEPSPFAAAPGEETRVASVPPAARKPEAAAPAVAPPVPAPPPSQPESPAGESDTDTLAAVPPPAEAEPPPAPPTVLDTGRSPPGLPKFALSFLQWSEDPARRFAFVSIDGAASQRVREGDTAGGCLVAEITPSGVRFKHDDKIFTIRPRH